MSHPNRNPAPTPPPPSPKPPLLRKHKSLSTNYLYREEAWLKRKDNHRRSKSLITADDIDELRGCIDLGFDFTSDPTKLSGTFPAIGLYCATLSPLASSSTTSSTTASDCGDSPAQPCSPHAGAASGATTALFSSGDNPEMVKTRLRQWAQVVACAARQSPC